MFKASPFVKKIIKDNNISLDNIKGTGPGGRIIKRDLSDNIQNNKDQILQNDSNELIPSQMRMSVAKRTTDSFKNIPHFYLKIESNIDKLINLKNNINRIDQESNISLNDLLIKALAIAQSKNPKTCVSWINNKIITYKSIDVSVAVGLEDGLITPIIRDADNKGIVEISQEMKELIIKAKNGKLNPEEYTGGTISLTNLGMFGISEFGAIINPPQSCILAVGRAKIEPIVENDKIVKATILKSTLSADHRVLDGVIAANLLKDFNDILENPLEIWLNSKDMKLN